MTWIKDAYSSIRGEQDINAEGCCTGKYISQGGIMGRTESTGLGVYYNVRELLNTESFCQKAKVSRGIKDKQFVVQGFGNVGYWAAHFFVEDGGIITTIVEYNSAIHSDAGLDIEDAKAYFVQHGTFEGYEKADEIITENAQEFMEKKCDILVPAATEMSIHGRNAGKLNCNIIAEGANGPTTFEAEEIMIKNGIVVIPDLLCNGGGVTVSYFEWLKNLDHVAPGKLTKKYQEKRTQRLLEIIGIETDEKFSGATELDIVYSGLEEIMCTATRDNWEYALKNDLIFRDACLGRAIKSVHQCYVECGLTV